VVVVLDVTEVVVLAGPVVVVLVGLLVVVLVGGTVVVVLVGWGLCVIVNVTPAMSSVPVRCPPALGAIVTSTLPLPVPPPGLTVRKSGLLLVAVHAQPASAVTGTLMDALAAPTV
jgi:hypothetical protein